MHETILTNARLILEDKVINGTIAFGPKGISDVSEGRSNTKSAIDVEDDYLAPGLIEMHTDNAEKHFVPRPGVFWPDGLSAILAHDAQIAAAGITTVYDSICAGRVADAKDHRPRIFAPMIKAIETAQSEGMFRVDHLIHIRCELPAPTLLDDITPFADHPLLKLVSLMDHTPGQRQWRNLEDLKRYNLGGGEKTAEEHERDLKTLTTIGPEAKARNWPLVVAMFKARGIALATHDDTTAEHVQEGAEAGAIICEFPTTFEAAQAARQHGMVSIAGAPNVVRGGSHSGGVSASALAHEHLLGGLSSDYVPASLLQAVIKLGGSAQIGLAQAMGLVTWKIADALGHKDRGRLRAGLRADIVRFKAVGPTPVVRSVWSQGARAI